MKFWATPHVLVRAQDAGSVTRAPTESTAAPTPVSSGIPRTLDWHPVKAVRAPEPSATDVPLAQSFGANRIKLITPLGVGGMGTVWLGIDLRERVYVAVKMILPHLVLNHEAIARFHREMRILAGIRSSRAVRLRASGVADGRPFAVMDRVRGASLSRRSSSGRLLPIRNVVQVVDQLLAALADLHAEGVVHRDVKPSNIMLSGQDDVQITLVDFGVAVSREEGPLEGEDALAAGTISHMSPEQLLAQSHGDAREDLWAAAVVAYECLVGRLPFEGPSFSLVQATERAGAFLSPSLLRNELPASLDDWFHRAFAPELADRFADANEMRAAWQDATAETVEVDAYTTAAPSRENNALTTLDPTVRIRRGPAAARAATKRGRRRVGGALACAVVLLIVAGLVLGRASVVSLFAEGERSAADGNLVELGDLAGVEHARANEEAHAARRFE